MKVCEIFLCVAINTINSSFINDSMDEIQKKTKLNIEGRTLLVKFTKNTD